MMMNMAMDMDIDNMDIDMDMGMDLGMDFEVESPEMSEHDLEKELALLHDEAAAGAAAAVPGAQLLIGNAPAAVAAASDDGLQQQQNLPANNEEAAAVVQQRIDEFERGITVARVAVQTARRIYRKTLASTLTVGSTFTPGEKVTIDNFICNLEMYISTYADHVRAHQFSIAPNRAGLVLIETVATIE